MRNQLTSECDSNSDFTLNNNPNSSLKPINSVHSYIGNGDPEKNSDLTSNLDSIESYLHQKRDQAAKGNEVDVSMLNAQMNAD